MHVFCTAHCCLYMHAAPALPAPRPQLYAVQHRRGGPAQAPSQCPWLPHCCPAACLQQLMLIHLLMRLRLRVLLNPTLWRRLLAKVGKNLDVMPGEEFRVALQEAHAGGAQVVLGDRPLTITLARVWHALGLWEKVKLTGSLLWTGLRWAERWVGWLVGWMDGWMDGQSSVSVCLPLPALPAVACKSGRGGVRPPLPCLLCCRLGCLSFCV